MFLPMFHIQNPRQGFQLSWLEPHAHLWANHNDQEKGYYVIGEPIYSRRVEEGLFPRGKAVLLSAERAEGMLDRQTRQMSTLWDQTAKG